MQEKLKNNVPLGIDDPIGYILDQGESVMDLALEWGFRTLDSVYKLKRYAYVPPANTAQRMGETFGWTAGEVVDHWLERVAQCDLVDVPHRLAPPVVRLRER